MNSTASGDSHTQAEDGGLKRAGSGRSYSAPAAACAAEVLLLLARERELSLADAARKLERSKTLTFRVMRELEERELVQRTDSGRFRLGISALEVGGAYATHAAYVNTARDVLRRLADITGETSNLGVLRGADVMCLINQEGHNVIGTFWGAGDRLPAHCTAIGKALLAELPPDERRELLGPNLTTLTPQSIATHKELNQALATVREQGYATTHGDAIYGLNAIAVTVGLPGRGGEPAAISISMSEDKFRTREQEFLAYLIEGRDRIQRETAGLNNLASRDGG